jgi:hypothetical protein
MKIMADKMSKEDLKWQARGDADTMARYQEILNDKPRMNRAIKEAERQAKDLQKRTNAMQSAAKVKAPRTTNRTSGKKK